MIKGYNLTNIGTPLKVLFTSYLCVVGIGYMMAFTQILLTHGMADGKFGLSVDDIVYSYYGDRTGTLLENKLNGSMKDMADEPDRVAIIKWVRDGAEESTFESSGAKMVFENTCIACHSAEAGMGLPDFSKFENIKERAQQDTGASVASLTRVSHIHLFGISFIFFFVGAIFVFAKNVPIWLKGTVIALPFVSQIMDIASWWLTKFDPMFAWLVLIGGSGMGIAFAFMWFVSVYEMWISKRDDSSVIDEH
ncbi:MAG: elongation factor-1 alpha [Ghiorsea sp.]|nr:elongation factor-1 alpha [Ghiorsea sp.]MDQ6980115.1 elongation factor-1 alpha [Ghiorsea sp.]MDQ7057540.1 elongation factor-1 alpha [Ghiorsea sp.]